MAKIKIIHILPFVKENSVSRVSAACLDAWDDNLKVYIKFPYITNITKLIYYSIKGKYIFHAHFPLASFICSFFILRGVIITTLHDQGYEYFKLYRGKLISKLMYFMTVFAIYRSKLVIVASTSISDGYKNFSNNKFITVLNFVSISIKDIEKYSLNANNIAVIGSSLVRVKGLDLVINAAFSLKNLNFYIYGLSSEDASRCGLNYKLDNVTFMGGMNQEDLYLDIMKKGATVAIFSRTEGFSLVALEATSLCIPLVVCNLDVFNEFLPPEIIPRFDAELPCSFHEALQISNRINCEARVKFSNFLINEFSMTNYSLKINHIYKAITLHHHRNKKF